ncbi:MAG TPA: leucyl aminopeptidase [Frankiaceae bacterium]|nr:leucyl aminopeptidase [Frankiaceae bacterium]
MATPELTLVTAADPTSTGADAVAVPVVDGAARGAAKIEAALGIELVAHAEREGFKGEPGEVLAVPALGRLGDTRAVLLVGLGKAADAKPATYRKAGAALVRKAGKATSVHALVTAEASPAELAAFAEGALLASYTFTEHKSDPKPAPLTRVALGVRKPSPKLDAALDRARHRASATSLVRDLANAPSLDKTPAWLAKQAQALGKKTGLTVSVLEPKELVAQGFGGILAVGSGSTRTPRLIRLDYQPAGKVRARVLLVGKGITFDTGGLSIKPNDGMAAMKTDMAGGAAVIATLQALPALGLPIRVTGLVPAAENMPSGSAVRPGDVIKHYGGRTVEVLNTDAEGRLVLADALAYGIEALDPDYVVDVATLTGAIGIALGKRTAGLFSNDDRLATALLDAAETAGERFWRMPLVEEYRRDLDSPVADMKNIGGKFGGGSIIAALFLREFVAGRRWAHLDIASSARSDGDEDEITKGATGFGVRTLLTWLESL